MALHLCRISSGRCAGFLREDVELLKKLESWKEVSRPQLSLKSEEALRTLLESGDLFNVELGLRFRLLV